MKNDDLMTRLEAGLRSVQWSNTHHRDSLRRQLCEVASRPARFRMTIRHRVLLAVCAVAALSAAGAAAYRWHEVIFLRGSIADEPATFELPVDEDGNVRLIFIDDAGAEHALIVRPEDVGEDGVIRGMQWHQDGPPKGREHEEP